MRSANEKVLSYLTERKLPVTVDQIADYFLLSSTTVHQALRRLEDEGKAQRHPPLRRGARKATPWSLARAMAVPAVAASSAVQPAAAVRSYPNIRGYDD